MVKYGIACAVLSILASANAFAPTSIIGSSRSVVPTTALKDVKSENVLQTEDTKRDKVMTFSYDMSLEPKYEKPTYPGTGNGLSGEEGEYDVVVIGSGMGGLSCGAISAKYGDKVIVLESHIKVGGQHTHLVECTKGKSIALKLVHPSLKDLIEPVLTLSE